VTRSTTVEVPQTATSPRWHPRGAGRSLRRLSGRVDTPANPVVAVLGPSAARLAWLSAQAKAGCGATLCRTSRRTGWDGRRHKAARAGTALNFPVWPHSHCACGEAPFAFGSVGCAAQLENASSSLALKIRRLADKSKLGDDGAVRSLDNRIRLFAGHGQKPPK
jgi:hypothetical protein